MPNGVAYDTEAGILSIAFRMKHTIIPDVVDGPEFWGLCFLNISVCICRHLGIFEPRHLNVDLPWGLTGATGSLMTFFVCFYNRHVFERYNVIYDITKYMEESCLQTVSSVRVQVPDRAVQRKVSKLLLASCFMFFYEQTTGGSESLADDADKEPEQRISKQEYAQLRKIELLDEFEIRALQKFCKRYGQDAIPSLLVLQWTMMLMRRATPDPTTRDDLLIGFDDRLYEIRGAMSDVCNIMNLPMPFQYFHIMNLMLVLNLVLWAYSLGCQDSYFAPVIYMFVQMMFQGVRELSTALSDPFGTDEVDFDVDMWMRSLYRRIFAIVEDPFEIADLSVDGDKPLKDPDSTSRKINLLVDRDGSGKTANEKEKRRRVKKSRCGVHPWTSHADQLTDTAPQLQRELETRRQQWDGNNF